VSAEIDRILAEAIGVKPERYDRCHYTNPPHVCDPGVMPACKGCSEDNWREIVKEYPAYSTDPAMALKWIMELPLSPPGEIFWSIARFENDGIKFQVSLTWNIGVNAEGDDIIKNILGVGSNIPDALVAAVVERYNSCPECGKELPKEDSCYCPNHGIWTKDISLPRLRPEIARLLEKKGGER